MPPLPRFLAASAIGLALSLSGPALGQPAPFLEGVAPQDSEEPVLLLADELIYDQDRGLVIARGTVYLAQGERLLRADQVTYNSQADIVTASGNIVVREPTGEFIFADYAELTGDLADGFVENVSIRFDDTVRLIANIGIRRNGEEIEVERAVYSPCALCPDNPEAAPLWQVRATRVTHSTATNNVEYENAYFDLFGIPVLWLPYFYHPDPTVERRTGFLPPDLGTSPNLGVFGTINNYWDLGPSRDLTTRLMITTDQSVMARGIYRERLSYGQFRIDASANYSDRSGAGESDPSAEDEAFRGHLFADGLFNIDRNWRAGFQVREVTDDTYLEVFRISDEDVLENRAFAEGFYGLSFATVEAYEFTDLRADGIAQPILAPWARLSFRGEPGDAPLGGQWVADASALFLTRADDLSADPSLTEGVDTFRLHASGGWQTEHFLPNGLVVSADASVAGTVYWAEDLPDPNDPTDRTLSDTTTRLVPTAGVEVAYPLVRYEGEIQQLVEPILSFRGTGLFDNGGTIPNNDSPAVELDEINLFSPSRYPGLDQVDDGFRVTYGVRLGWFDPNGGPSGTAFIGQSYRFAYDEPFAEGTGLSGDLSDIVGQVSIDANEWASFDWRFRVDTDTLTATRSEVGLDLSTDWATGTARYTFIDAQAGTRTGDNQEELFVAGRTPLSDYWSLNGSYRYDVEDAETRNFSVGIQYVDECLLFGVEWTRDFTSDRENESGDSIMFRLSLTHLSGDPLEIDTSGF